MVHRQGSPGRAALFAGSHREMTDPDLIAPVSQAPSRRTLERMFPRRRDSSTGFAGTVPDEGHVGGRVPAGPLRYLRRNRADAA